MFVMEKRKDTHFEWNSSFHTSSYYLPLNQSMNNTKLYKLAFIYRLLSRFHEVADIGHRVVAIEPSVNGENVSKCWLVTRSILNVVHAVRLSKSQRASC